MWEPSGRQFEDDKRILQRKIAEAVLVNFTDGAAKGLAHTLMTVMNKYCSNESCHVDIAGVDDERIAVHVKEPPELHASLRITDVFCRCTVCDKPVLIIKCSSSFENTN